MNQSKSKRKFVRKLKKRRITGKQLKNQLIWRIESTLRFSKKSYFFFFLVSGAALVFLAGGFLDAGFLVPVISLPNFILSYPDV